MSKIDNNHTEKSLYKDAYCNALGYCKNTTEKVNVKAVKFGAISLDLCENCVNLFNEGVTN